MDSLWVLPVLGWASGVPGVCWQNAKARLQPSALQARDWRTSMAFNPHPLPYDLVSEDQLQDRGSRPLELHSVPSSQRGQLWSRRWLCCQGSRCSALSSPHTMSMEVAHGEGCSPFFMAQAGAAAGARATPSVRGGACRRCGPDVATHCPRRWSCLASKSFYC